jgi:predicted HTH transcriptional regulator
MAYDENGIGHAENESSEMAAKFNAGGKITLRAQVRHLFQEHRKLTVEQVSKLMNRAEISVQPRVSELKNSGFIQDSGQTKMGKWGTHITVWEIC